MKRLLVLLALSSAASVSAGSALFMRGGLEKTIFCQKYGCQRTSKRSVTSEISPTRIESRYRLKNFDATVTTRHTLEGYLLDATLIFNRSPLSLEDSGAALVLVKTMVGGTYSGRLLERCFEKAETAQDKEYPYWGESLLAGGDHWGVKCQLHSEGNTTISEVWVFAAD